MNRKRPEADGNLRSALADAATAGAALALVIKARKALDAKITLGFLAKRAGIPSTGYLSDVVNGRRQLNAKYRDAVLSALNLDATERGLFAVLFALDQAKEGDADRPALERERDAMQKLLKTQSLPMPARLGQLFFAFEVFAAFGLSGNRATRGKLRDFFGAARGVELDQALGILMSAGLVERRGTGGEHGSAGDEFLLVDEQVNFFGEKDGISHLDYLRLALRDAEQKVNVWYQKPDEAYFSSSIISVSDQAFRAALPKIKDLWRRAESDAETAEADRLVRFNVQIYPIK